MARLAMWVRTDIIGVALQMAPMLLVCSSSAITSTCVLRTGQQGFRCGA